MLYKVSGSNFSFKSVDKILLYLPIQNQAVISYGVVYAKQCGWNFLLSGWSLNYRYSLWNAGALLSSCFPVPKNKLQKNFQVFFQRFVDDYSFQGDEALKKGNQQEN